MELNFIEVSEFILAVVALVTGYFGWKARAEKNKLKEEVEGMRASNTEQDIKNQSSWIDLYKKLHDDQAERLTNAEQEIQGLKKTLFKFEHAFKKYYTCPHYANCPIQHELSKFKDREEKPSKTNGTGHRQREPAGNQDNKSDNHATGDGKA